MAITYYVQGIPVSEEEADQKLYSGELEKFNRSVAHGEKASLKLHHGVVKSESFETSKFTPIGIGKPLCIQIENIYTGDAPERFLGKKDVLGVSGVKSNYSFDAAPKVINHIISKAVDKTTYELSAFDKGSNIVYYSPALDMDHINCSFHLIADTFNEKTFDNISNLLSKAGALFAPAQSVLLAGSLISGMIGNLGKAIFETSPFFKDSFNVRLNSPGHMITKADHVSVIQDKNKKELEDYTPKAVLNQNESSIRLVHKVTGKEYDGEAPYILISINGKERDQLKDYKNTLATAGILQKFYGSDRDEQVVATIQEAMVLYNDFKFYNKAKDLKEKMETMTDSSSPEYKSSQELMKAYIGNIDNKLFKDQIES